MKTQLKPAIRGTSGQAIVEMAFVMPTFLLLLFSLFQIAMIFFVYENATYACRTGARYASVRSLNSIAPCTTASVQSVVTAFIYAPKSSTVTITPSWPGGNVVGATVNVSVKVVYPFKVPFLSLTQITFGSTAQRMIVN